MFPSTDRNVQLAVFADCLCEHNGAVLSAASRDSSPRDTAQSALSCQLAYYKWHELHQHGAEIAGTPQ